MLFANRIRLQLPSIRLTSKRFSAIAFTGRSTCSFLLVVFLLLITLPGLAQQKAATPKAGIKYGSNPAAGQYITARGIKHYVEIYGKGKPLLLLHGNGGSIESFYKTIPYFEKQYQVIAVDSRAHGKSIDSGDSLSFDMMADDCIALLDHLKIDSAYVIGWSDGGITALILALRYPNRIRKIAATGANIFVDNTVFTDNGYLGMVAEYARKKDKPYSNAVEKNKWKLFLLDFLYPTLTIQDMQKINRPSLIIAGDKDAITLEHTLLIYKHIPHAQLWILPNSGHATLLEHPRLFNQQVDRFFQSN